MEIHSAAIFLASSLLIGFGLLFIAICVVLLNNLFYKFWKPIKLVAYHVDTSTTKKSRATKAVQQD
jgi:predicted membrane protein